LEPDFRRGVAGLALGVAGAAIILAYTAVNRRARRRSALAHWGLGWILGAAGMTAMAAGWTLLGLAGPWVGAWGWRAAGAGVGILALGVYVASSVHVGRWRKPAEYGLGLRTEGIYAHVRHPQALALILAAVGTALVSGSLFFLATLPLWLAYWTAYTYFEERLELLPSFGEDYRRYQARTPRLIPRIGRRPLGGSGNSR